MTTLKGILLPDPPAPIGINIFPLSPPAKVILTVPLPDQATIDKKHEGTMVEMDFIKTLTNQKLEFKQQWVRVTSCTITPNTPYSHSLSISVGTALSVEARQEFSASLGLNLGDLIDIGAKLSLSLSEQVTVAAAVTTEDTFNAQTEEPKASFMWWQLRSTYTITGHEKLVVRLPNTSLEIVQEDKDFSIALVNDESTSMSTQFPASVKAEISHF